MTDEIKRKINQINSGKIPEGYSKRRWILYPNDWDYVKLNTCLSENKERNKDGVYTKDDVLSVSGESGVVNQIEFMGRSYAGESVLPYHVVETGDIVYTKSPLKQNPHGIIKLNKGNPGIVSTLYAVYHCCNPITAEYLNYFFEIDEYLNSYLFPLVKKGAKNDMKVNNEDVIKGEIALPPIEEQEEIVKILKQCDKVIKLKRKRIDEEKKLKKVLMQKLLNPDSGIRLPGFNSQWNKTSIGEMGEVITGNTPSTAINDYYENGIFPWITPTDINNKYIDNSERKLTMDGLEKARKLPAGTLLVTCIASIGKNTILKKEGSCNQQINALIVNDKFDVEFLYYIIENNKEYFLKIAGVTATPIINMKTFSNMKFLVPEYSEQKAIANILNAKDGVIDKLENELEQWQNKKKSLMQLMLTGIVRVK